MTSQFEIKWTNFDNKFEGGKQQNAFEALCYHLFCCEFGLKNGLFRYKNQTGIETDPAQVGDEIIGFQAKHCDAATSLSSKKTKLIQAIKNTKRKNPSLTKIMFYVNKEFSESTDKEKKEPEYKVEIEKVGKDSGVIVEWRVRSHIEMQLAKQENKYVAEYYFGGDRSVWKYIENIEKDTKNLLCNINSYISCNGNEIRFDYDLCKEEYNNCLSENSNWIIIDGDGGSGKTAFVKEWLEQTEPIFFAWKLSEFNVTSMQEVFSNYGNYTVYDFVDVFNTDTTRKYILLDSAEAIYEFRSRDAITDFLKILWEHKWTVIFTIRTVYKENLKYTFKEIPGLKYKEITIPPVAIENLKNKLKEIGVLIPNNKKIQELLTLPFYLNEYIQMYSEDVGKIATVMQFMKSLWEKKILGEPYQKDRMHIRRGNMMYQLTDYKVKNNSFYIRERNIENPDEEALQFLIRDEVVVEDDKRRCFISHDIYEEWTWIHYIEELYEDCGNNLNTFFLELSDVMLVRRCFRQWIQWNLEDNRDDVLNFILSAIEKDWIGLKWKDEIYIAILDSKYVYEFLESTAELCFGNEAFVLKRIMYLLETTRKKYILENKLAVPTGYGWGAVIFFIYKNYDRINECNIDKKIIINILNDWSSNYHKGSVCKYAGLIALKMLQDKSRYYKEEDILIDIILGSSGELTDYLQEMFVVAKQGDRKYEELFIKAITTFSGLVLVSSAPEFVIEIARFYWLKSDKDRGYSNHYYWENIYGINPSYDLKYNPPSAFQTPIYWLLHTSEEKTLNFVLDILNYIICNYVKKMKEKENYTVPTISIDIEGNLVEQYVDERLWSLYRGLGNAPHVIGSILAALEKYLLEYVEQESDLDKIYDKIKLIILGSNSVVVTSIAVSLIEAYPDKLYRLAYWLVRMPEIIMLDRNRLGKEETLRTTMEIDGMFQTLLTQIYVEERKKAYKEKFRKKLLEHVILEYQIRNTISEEYKNKLWELLDEEHKKYADVVDEDERGIVFQRYYIQMDIRCQKFQKYQQGDVQGIVLEPCFDERQNEKLQLLEKRRKLQNEKAALSLWVNARFEENQAEYVKYEEYEKNPYLAYEEMTKFEEFSEKYPELAFMVRDLELYISCVLIRDFEKDLSLDVIEECVKIIRYKAMEMLKYPNQMDMHGVGNDAVIIALIVWIQKKQLECDYELLLKIFLLKNSDFKKLIVKGISKYSKELTACFIEVIVQYQSIFDKIYKRYDEKVLELFDALWEQRGGEILGLKTNLQGIKEIELQGCNLESLIYAMELSINSDDCFQMILIQFLKHYVENENHLEDFEDIWKGWELLAQSLFACSPDIISERMQMVTNSLKCDEWCQRLLQYIIFEADKNKDKNRFWIIWNGLNEKITQLVKAEEEHQKHIYEFSWKGEYELNNIISEYLLAGSKTWREEAKKWELLSFENKIFWEKCSKEYGFHKATLYGIGYFINHIGYELFRDEAIIWIYDIINNNQHLWEVKLLTNTIYYLEKYLETYCDYHKCEIKKNQTIKTQVERVLDFLVEKGSTIGFMLRDEL